MTTTKNSAIVAAISIAAFGGPAAANAAATAPVTAATTADEIAELLDEPNSAEATPRSRAAAVWQSLNPDMSLILDIAAAYFTSDDPLMTGAHDPNVNGFNFRQLEMTLGAAVDPYFRMDAALVFSLFGVEIEEAYMTTLALPAGLQVRLGQFFTRLGRINSTHPHAWAFVSQPHMIGRYFGSEGNRGVGAEASILLPLPWYVELVASAINADGGATKKSFYGANDLGVHNLGDFQYTPAIKQFFALSDAWSLNVGLSGAFGPNGTGRDNRTDIYGGDLYLKFRPIDQAGSATVVALQSEWLTRWRQVPADLLRDYSSYTYLVWQFHKRWTTGVRYDYGSATKNDAGQIVADDLDPDWLGERHRGSANLTFLPSEFSRFRLQVERDIPTWRDSQDWAFMLDMEFSIGAHGAHAF